MLTCARPSARAISATVPGRFSTPIRSSWSVAAGEVGLEQPAAVLAGGAVPGADRCRVAGADQLGGLPQPLDHGVDLVGDRLAVGGEDVAPDRRVRARDPGRVAEARCRPRAGARTPPPSAAAASPTSTLASTCGRWLTVAISRSWVSASIACGRAPRSATDALEAVVVDAARALGRRQVPARALEQVGARVLDPRGLGAGERVAADEPLRRRRPGAPAIELALGRADVGDDRVSAARRRAPRRPAPAARRPAPRRRRRSAPSTASATGRAGAVERPELERRARAFAGSGSKPATSASRRRFAASPIEPPISPTPRTAIASITLDGRVLPATSATRRT